MLKIKNIVLSYLTIVSSIINTHDFNIISISDVLKKYPEIEYIKCHDIQPFQYKQFPISKFPELQPNNGLLAETFILKIPNGQACSLYGWINIDNNILKESFSPYYSLESHIQLINKNAFQKVKKVKGKVAVLTMNFDYCYFHWIYNILSRLTLLEMHNIEYDWLYVACDKPYMKEILALWGVDQAKIIQPFGDTICIQADDLIVPSHIGARTPEKHQYSVDWIPLDLLCQQWSLDSKIIPSIGSNTKTPSCIIPQNISISNMHIRWTPLCSIYCHPQILNYMKNKLLSCLQSNNHAFSKKVFISRKDASIRNMINEDEIFALFENKGFTRYNLARLSVLEQIELFHNADIIVAAHGAALTNLLFCKPKTHVVEIFQARSESCFYYLSQDLNLNHYCIKTMEFTCIEGQIHTYVDSKIIQEFIDNHQFIF